MPMEAWNNKTMQDWETAESLSRDYVCPPRRDAHHVPDLFGSSHNPNALSNLVPAQQHQQNGSVLEGGWRASVGSRGRQKASAAARVTTGSVSEQHTHAATDGRSDVPDERPSETLRRQRRRSTKDRPGRAVSAVGAASTRSLSHPWL